MGIQGSAEGSRRGTSEDKGGPRWIKVDYGGAMGHQGGQGWSRGVPGTGGGAWSRICVAGVTSAAEELDLSVLAWKCMGLLRVRPHSVTHTHKRRTGLRGSSHVTENGRRRESPPIISKTSGAPSKTGEKRVESYAREPEIVTTAEVAIKIPYETHNGTLSAVDVSHSRAPQELF